MIVSHLRRRRRALSITRLWEQTEIVEIAVPRPELRVIGLNVGGNRRQRVEVGALHRGLGDRRQRRRAVLRSRAGGLGSRRVGRCGLRRQGGVGELGGNELDLGGGEGAAVGNVGGAVGEVEVGGAASEAEIGGIKSPSRLLGGVIRPEPYPLPAIWQPNLGHILAPLPLPNTPVPLRRLIPPTHLFVPAQLLRLHILFTNNKRFI